MEFLKYSIVSMLLFSMVPAQAAIVHIDLEASPFASSSTQDSILYQDGLTGLNMNVTAYSLDANDGHGNITSRTQLTGSNGVYDGSTGMGVYVGGLNSGDYKDIDGGNNSTTDPDEGLLFTFDRIVELTYINFGAFGSNDDFNLEIDGVNIMHDIGQYGTHTNITGHQNWYTNSNQSDKFNFQGLVGSSFLIWADGSNDEFRIDDFNVSVVPEPSIVALLSLGMMGIAFSRRKIKK